MIYIYDIYIYINCELVGSFLFSQLQQLNINIGLYRDDGLAVVNSTPRVIENIKKDICRIFNDNGLCITIEANKMIINFLDITFNLNQCAYQPYTKPSTTIKYVHHDSNHPPGIIKKYTCRHQQTSILFIFQQSIL